MATEHPNLEKQANLLEWAEDREKLEQRERDAEDKGYLLADGGWLSGGLVDGR